ncbi:hypothetical protein ACFV4N_11260 [Actinosynnema sp. NPDC059797]
MPLELLVVTISAGAGIVAAVINAVGRIAAARLARSRREAEVASKE